MPILILISIICSYLRFPNRYLGYRSYEQFERATVFQKSMSVQAIELSDELLQAKQEYLQHYNGSNNTNAPSQRSASYIDGSNSILSEKKRGRGDSIRKGL